MSTVGALLAAIATAAGAALGFAALRHAARRARLRKAAAGLSASTCREVLGLVDRAGAEDGAPVLLLRPRPDSVADPASRLGGDPDLPPGSPWPRDASGVAAPFLAQLRLQVPPLPAAWTDRRILVFGGAKGTVLAFSAPPVAAPPAPAPKGVRRSEPVPLGVTRLPRVEGDGDEVPSPYAPALLLRRVPAVRTLLARHGEPERLLPYVLVRGIDTYELDTSDVILMGGEPELVHGAHGARCKDCSRPMTFLVQLGDVLALPGRAPVVYVYGCDAHPDRVLAFVDHR